MVKCRLCGNDMEVVWDLGNIYPSGFIKFSEKRDKFPLRLAICGYCHVVQLADDYPQDSMYREYWYKSSLNKSMLRDLEDIVKGIEKRIELHDGDIVLDIGCNDGSLFDFYTNKNLFKVGFDPALNLKQEAEKHCEIFINDYFPGKSTIFKLNQAKVITTIAMFYDIPDPKSFIKEIRNHLAQDGLWVIQFTDLLSMFKANAFDNICHEHLFYYTLYDMLNLLESNGFSVSEVEYNKVNGGSIRLYVKYCNKIKEDFKEFSYETNVDDELQRETIYLDTRDMEDFRKSIKIIKDTTMSFINNCISKGKTIGLLGASTKANTLLQYFGINSTHIRYAYEVNKDKYGLFTVGSCIEILPEEDLLKNFPDYLLVGPWHFIDSLLQKDIIKSYLADGGNLIVPLPEFRIYNANVAEKSTGEIIDSLITTVVKCFFAQEDIMNTSLSESERLASSVKAQKLNARRNALIRELDKRFGGCVTPSEKTY